MTSWEFCTDPVTQGSDSGPLPPTSGSVLHREGSHSRTKVCAPEYPQPSSVHSPKHPYTPVCTRGCEICSQETIYGHGPSRALDEHSELFGQEILGNPGAGAHSGQALGFGPDGSHPVRRGVAGGQGGGQS